MGTSYQAQFDDNDLIFSPNFQNWMCLLLKLKKRYRRKPPVSAKMLTFSGHIRRNFADNNLFYLQILQLNVSLYRKLKKRRRNHRKLLSAADFFCISRRNRHFKIIWNLLFFSKKISLNFAFKCVTIQTKNQNFGRKWRCSVVATRLSSKLRLIWPPNNF